MEFFNKTKAVKLRSIHNKYLVADDDNKTVRQSRNGLTRKARWIVEPIDHSSQAIRLKSFHGGYLTASSSHFLLGFTGDKVLLTRPEHPRDLSVEWAPVRDGFQVRLVTAFGGTCLRANGGMPPWKNSVTHDGRSVKRSWILWEVEEVEIPENEESTDYFSEIGSDIGSEIGSPRVSIYTDTSPMESIKNNAIYCYKSPHIVVSSNNKIPSGIELFRDAKAVRLRSHHNKYLAADGDEISVTQDRNGSSNNTHWTVEFLSHSENRIRLKSCYGKYLTASNKLFLFGMAGRKVLQTADRLASSVEWEPILDGHHVRLKTRNAKFLRANGGVPPWRNSVTHDVPNRTATQDWILWDVDAVETALSQPKPGVLLELEGYPESLESGSSLESNQWDNKPPSVVRQESNDSKGSSRSKTADGRVISYSVADEYGNVDEGSEERSFMFKGNGLYELTTRLEEETGLEEIIVCSRSPLDGKLKPLRLQLPPQNVDMHIVVVPPSSRGE